MEIVGALVSLLAVGMLGTIVYTAYILIQFWLDK